MKRLCRVYRSPRLLETYLYVDDTENLARVPQDLLQRFGRPEEALCLVLDENRRLARADARRVIAALDEQGYYLQMPPPPGEDVITQLDRQWGACRDNG